MTTHVIFRVKPGMVSLFLVILKFCVFSSTAAANNVPQAGEGRSLPDGFVYLTDVVPDVILEIRYYSADNFMGSRVDSYNAPVAILSREAAEALRKAGQVLDSQGYVIKIFDAYRPQSAVAHFVRWAKDSGDNANKEYFYPGVDKANLFKLGYISEKSAHSRGSTVDLTIVDKKTGREVDMGSPFDFFGEISRPDSNQVTPEQKANRMILQKAMLDAGFLAIKTEWWHFRLAEEPYPDSYFDFPVDF